MEHEFLKVVLGKIEKDTSYKVDFPKAPESKATIEEGESPLFYILGSSYVPEMPEGFS